MRALTMDELEHVSGGWFGPPPPPYVYIIPPSTYQPPAEAENTDYMAAMYKGMPSISGSVSADLSKLVNDGDPLITTVTEKGAELLMRDSANWVIKWGTGEFAGNRTWAKGIALDGLIYTVTGFGTNITSALRTYPAGHPNYGITERWVPKVSIPGGGFWMPMGKG
jgi:hypothetical protein